MKPGYSGLVPAAGKATRIHGLPKMLLPVEDDHLLGRMCKMMALEGASIKIGTNGQMYPVLAQFTSHHLYLANTRTMCETLRQARKHCNDDFVLFGMPDSYFEDRLAFHKLRMALEAGADLAVGIFQTRPEQRSKLGMVQMNGDGIQVIEKPETTDLIWAWGVMAWRPVFWELIEAEMAHVGYAINPAVETGLNVCLAQMTGGYWDCGTFEEYAHLCTHLQEKAVMV